MIDPEDLVSDVYKKNTKLLFKSFLILIEDLHRDHLINFKKLRDALPEEYHALLNQADYFDQYKLQYLRKILDMGNESIRDAENSLEKFYYKF